MDTALIIIGIFLILIGILDVFITIIYYEGSEFLSSFLQRQLWNLFRKIAHLLPGRSRFIFLSSGAPMMIIFTLSFWIGIEITGFALIFYTGITEHHFSLNLTDHRHALMSAFYFSSVTIPTLGFGDITPSTFFFQMASSIEALIGFTIMTLSLTYILNIYKVIQQFRVMSSALHHETSDTGDIMVIIEHHWNSFNFSPEDTYFRTITYSLLDWFENIHQYPLAYYYFSTRSHLSIPFTFKIIGEMLSLYYFCTPHPGVFARCPALKSLYNSFTSIMSSMLYRFSKKRYTLSEPLEYAQFIQNLTAPHITDHNLQQFVSSLETMQRYSGKSITINHHELYNRYCQWLIFYTQVQQFTEFTAKNLGYTI